MHKIIFLRQNYGYEKFKIKNKEKVQLPENPLQPLKLYNDG